MSEIIKGVNQRSGTEASWETVHLQNVSDETCHTNMRTDVCRDGLKYLNTSKKKKGG